MKLIFELTPHSDINLDDKAGKETLDGDRENYMFKLFFNLFSLSS